MLTSISNIDNPDYWSFRGNSKREYCHSLISYPAMMVPKMQGELLDVVLDEKKDIASVLDPFVGSGTVLGEAMLRGLDFGGVDVNPIAILACQVKSKLGSPSCLESEAKELIKNLERCKKRRVEIDFPSIDKWFSPQAQIELSRIRSLISEVPMLWVRRFFWLAMAESVRLTSNSRLSTYKLHAMVAEDIEKIPSPIKVFVDVLSKNIREYQAYFNRMYSAGYAIGGRYLGSIELILGDVCKKASLLKNKYDLLVTSPPYGDNSTTVPYGQFSYLPLQWIMLEDISKSKNIKKCLDNISYIDKKSLGGEKHDFCERLDYLKGVSPIFEATVEKLSMDGQARLVSFIFDVDRSLEKILPKMKSAAPMIWTLGNRRINNIEIPFDQILSDLMYKREVSLMQSFKRNIPSKRMATRNRSSKTMNQESIMIFSCK